MLREPGDKAFSIPHVPKLRKISLYKNSNEDYPVICKLRGNLMQINFKGQNI